MGKVDIRICECRKLTNQETFGTSDPYCMVSCEGKTYRTSVKKSTLNPKWDEKFSFMVADPASAQVMVRVRDHNVTSDEPMGYYNINLSGLYKGKVEDSWHVMKGCRRGEIRLRVMAVDFGKDAVPAKGPVPAPYAQAPPPQAYGQPPPQQGYGQPPAPAGYPAPQARPAGYPAQAPPAGYPPQPAGYPAQAPGYPAQAPPQHVAPPVQYQQPVPNQAYAQPPVQYAQPPVQYAQPPQGYMPPPGPPSAQVMPTGAYQQTPYGNTYPPMGAEV
eukprot:TRINITY_DN520_c8_g1_i1.p1 TRINITY_DN520_c8_g1~~TRINITY_DN520_c8_g1_i1.p1  ORF type:complete len:291 (+),score=55.98 TRINITY_DN520_c8_g1_i1:57-875(+)